jgi:2-polyprenyl-3-methyl-5-hydroxy-6-metoxy-1,4-benzoquinol methylase/glycosyltransferase involved in cell wall biosynthesis
MSGVTKYQATIDRANKNNSHTLSIDFIEAGCNGRPQHILEVGCSSGYFGSALKELGHTVCGVEMDANSSEIAKGRLDEVHCCTIEEYFRQNPDQKFDVITFGDVLEHLVAPEVVLVAARQHLRAGGRVVASIPNVAHASIRCMSLQGDWSYGELGILDKAHLRFFTQQSALQLFADSGFVVSHIQAVRLGAQQAAEMCGLTLDPASLDKVSSIRGDDTLENFQYIISARPLTEKELPSRKVVAHKRALRILAACDAVDSAISKIRLIAPLQGFANEGCRLLRALNFNEVRGSDVAWADVVVIQRGANALAAGIGRAAQQAGKPVVYEVDDLLIDLPDFLGHHELYIKNKGVIEGMIRQATVVTSTNENLKQALVHLNPNVAICPNYFEAQSRAISPFHDASGAAQINLVVASSDRVRMDMVAPALVAIQKKYSGRVLVQAVGPIADTLVSYGVVCNKLDLIPHEDFIATVGGFKNAIGVIPLDDSKFSACKSPVKYFDYSQAGLASVCSNVSPYKDVIENGLTGVLCNNETADWVEHLSRLIEQPALRLQIALNAQRHVSEHHNIQKSIDAWAEVFQKLAPDDVAVYMPPPPVPLVTKIAGQIDLGLRFVKDKNRQRRARRKQRKAQAKQADTQRKTRLGA